MEPEELRLGNLVYDKDDNVIKIETIFPFNVNVDFTSDEGQSISSLKPIPLTEEWLLKFGFTKKEWEYNYEYSIGRGFVFRRSMNGGRFYFHQGFYEENKIDIEYVHQLQNLHFSLTGEELILNDENKYTYSSRGEAYKRLK